jgi:hypothetical protein
MENLKEYETGIQAVELATRNGLKFLPSGSELSIVKRSPEIPGYDKNSAKLAVEILRNQREHIKPITSDPEDLRKALQTGQEALSGAYTHAETLLDLFDRLEKAYRIVYPDLTGCIHGEKGCPSEAIVNCTACSGVAYAA